MKMVSLRKLLNLEITREMGLVLNMIWMER